MALPKRLFGGTFSILLSSHLLNSRRIVYIVQQASEVVEERLDAYQKSAMDEGLELELSEWIDRRKQKIGKYN